MKELFVLIGLMMASHKVKPTKHEIMILAIKYLIENGATKKEAFDKVLGDGAYSLADEKTKHLCGKEKKDAFEEFVFDRIYSCM